MMSYEETVYAAAAGVSMIIMLISLAISIVVLIGMWNIYKKAGEPGWGAIIPFYNMYILYKITFGNGWFFLFTFIPIANIVFGIMVLFKLAKVFGRGVGFGFGLLFLSPIFVCILGFGSARYIGPQ